MSFTPASHGGASVGSLDVFQGMVSAVYVLLGVEAVLLDGHGIQGENYVALLPGSRMSGRCHYRNWMLGI